ncbi:MAG: T9SS type A sorting domain-containing protein [candidate division Zixibacteria bacterium]|nr:T9SS type A sorting domain-containing protein [candidate division Zixibacteria bacterium]
MFKASFTFAHVLALVLAIAPVQGAARTGDVTNVVSHANCKVVTDPSKGFNAYRNWAVFPSAATAYRRIVLSVTYRCPDSLRCGEWDYIDGIFLRRTGGTDSPSRDIELARMISPYGSRFGPSWHFTWQTDITDFGFLLHDSVEIEFNHGGYESNTDRGWLITLDFALTEGPPALPILGMDTLWNGTFPYGDTSKPIENLLRPIPFTDRFGAQWARLRIVQTGHGMDDSENCAEFCSKTRRVLLDDSVRDERQLWRRCGTNPLYPQAGTWLYDRANWCPGSIVRPDIVDFAIDSGSTHSLAIAMQPYSNTKTPTANYCLHSYLFYCGQPRAAHDVSVLDILAPSSANEYERLNPICGNPQIRIRNSGRLTLRSLEIKYQIDGGEPIRSHWEGDLAPLRDTIIDLPGPVISMREGGRFEVTVSSPDRVMDEYPADNTMASYIPATPVYPTRFILTFLTNKESTQNGYQLIDAAGNVVRSRQPGSLRPGTIYRDTLAFSPGCYQLVFADTTGDGLDFWANPDGGYGYVRLLDTQDHLIRSFNADFGSEIRHSFRVGLNAQPLVPTDTLPLVNPFPVRNKGIFSVELFQNEPGEVAISITDEGGKKTVFQRSFPDIKEATVQLDISNVPDGVYFLTATSGGHAVTRRIRVKHGD